MTTEAGKRLREYFMAQTRAPWQLPMIDGHIATIEAEAVAAERERIRAAVADLPHNMWTTAQGRERVLRIIEETP